MQLSVSSATLPVLFENAAAQLLAQLLNPDEIGETLQEKIVVEGEDMSSLLESWLQALLDLVRDQKILPKRISLKRIDTAPGKPYSTRAEIIGELFDPHRHTLRKKPESLKIGGATLQSEESGWSARITL